jgi:hypothetical protein
MNSDDKYLKYLKYKKKYILLKKLIGGHKLDEISREILTKNILNQEMIEEINKHPGLKDYLIDKYYTIYKIRERKVNDKGILIPQNPYYHDMYPSVDFFAQKVYYKLIADVTITKDRPDNKYIIFAPGDTPSKIIAYMLLIPKYVKGLEENNIEIISFPLSDASEWDDEAFKSYLNNILSSVPFDKSNKSNIHFGIIDAIYRGNTIKKINDTLSFFGYKNIIEIPHELVDDESFYDDKWNPKYSYNLSNSNDLFTDAERRPFGKGTRCMMQFKESHYLGKEKTDDKDNEEQLYNCNLYIYYWYIMQHKLELSKEILTKNILNHEILEEINRYPELKDFLIDEYYRLFSIEKRIDATGRLIPENPGGSKISVDIFAKRVYDKLIADVSISPLSDNKYIIFAPGDTPSKIVAYMLLIPEYAKGLKDNNIEIILFPLSAASKWDDNKISYYIRDLLSSHLDAADNKDNIHFGIIDAISRGNTLFKINQALKFLGYKNIIQDLYRKYKRTDEFKEQFYKEWTPKYSYNLIDSGHIFEYAENYGRSKNRCVERYKEEHYRGDTLIDDEDYKEQLYNCNVYIYYWLALDRID